MNTPQINQQWQCNETESVFTVITMETPYVSIQREGSAESKALVIDHFIKTHTKTNNKTMSATYTCPDDRAEFIGSCNNNKKTTDYWAHTFRDIGEIYLFAVTDDSGSFATITLPYSKANTEPPMHKMTQWVMWNQNDEQGNTLNMAAPSSSWYPGMHDIAFDWLWKHLYPNSKGGKSCGFRIHSKAECHSRWVFKAARMLQKAGLKLTDEQFDLLLPPIDD